MNLVLASHLARACKYSYAFFISSLFTIHSAFAVDYDLIEKQLKTYDAKGWIHGAVENGNEFVFTYREADNFFDYALFPLIPATDEVREVLATLHRHDQVLIKGQYLKNSKAPIRHIWLEDIRIVKKFVPGESAPPYEYKTKLPDDLAEKTDLVGIVHAVGNDGHILVLEYGDSIIPVPFSDTQLTKTLYRNDKVHLHFVIQTTPDLPVHLMPDPAVSQPLNVLSRVVDLHGQPASVIGHLIMFPKSPEINQNVFAVQQIDSDGASRQFTLVNFEDMDRFVAIRKKLQNLWDLFPAKPESGRNKLFKPGLKVRATGIYNVADQNQANVQILLDGPESVTVGE